MSTRDKPYSIPANGDSDKSRRAASGSSWCNESRGKFWNAGLNEDRLTILSQTNEGNVSLAPEQA